MSDFVIRNLHVSVEGKQILNGVNLEIKKEEIHSGLGKEKS